jgi:predicted GNAT family N-acyltransferase
MERAGQLSSSLAAQGYLSRRQAHLQRFYASFGFQPVTDIYDEDGIAHIGMAREGRRLSAVSVTD